jgi:thiosulfate:glutathione sulfurtransferase
VFIYVKKVKRALNFTPLMQIKQSFARLRMGQMASMFSSFAGEKWYFDKILAHSQKSTQELKESREYLIDVREENEIRGSGAIPNAINIPLGHVESALKFPKIFNQIVMESRTFPDAEGDKLIFTCQSGMRAGRAAATAQALGYENVAVYPGSFSDWSSHKK